ncbi:F-box/LRR-repeat protein 2, partial [Operophtera brumata]
DPEDTPNTDESYSILDILNRDCLDHILNYIPILDIIRTERVSKRWQNMMQEHLEGRRTFKTSWWEMAPPLTTAVLRRVLQKLGGSLTRLHIDHHWSALNDRTAHILTDSSLVQIVKNDSSIESLVVSNNTHVTGLFLTGSSPPKLNSLSFYNCYSLQGTVLCAAIDTLPLITTLRLDMCPISMWKIIPLILQKLLKLEELSLSEYTSVDCLYTQNSDFGDAIANLPELKVLNLSKNIYVTNAVLKKLKRLDVSYLAALTDRGLTAASRLPLLRSLTARGNPALTARPFVACLSACPLLQEVDACGCDSVTEEVVCAALLALDSRPRLVALHLAGTAAAVSNKVQCCVTGDLSNPNLRPDFMDQIFDDSSEDSFDDMYDFDHDAFNDFFAAEDELFLDEEDFEDYEGIAYGLHGPDIILL